MGRLIGWFRLHRELTAYERAGKVGEFWAKLWDEAAEPVTVADEKIAAMYQEIFGG